MWLANHAVYTDDPASLAEANIIIVAAPTPVDEAHVPGGELIAFEGLPCADAIVAAVARDDFRRDRNFWRERVAPLIHHEQAEEGCGQPLPGSGEYK